jgi:hypothetical protein
MDSNLRFRARLVTVSSLRPLCLSLWKLAEATERVRDRKFESISLQQGVGRTSDHDKAQVEVAVRYEGRVLQIPEQRHRRHFVKVTVQVHEYPDGTLAIFHGPRRLAGYRPDGALIEEDAVTRSAA